MCSNRCEIPVIPGRSFAEPTRATQHPAMVGERWRGMSTSFIPLDSTCSSNGGPEGREPGGAIGARVLAGDGARAHAAGRGGGGGAARGGGGSEVQRGVRARWVPRARAVERKRGGRRVSAALASVR